MLRSNALCQGTTSVVPKQAPQMVGFSLWMPRAVAKAVLVYAANRHDQGRALTQSS
jgi:hypothetical protein